MVVNDINFIFGVGGDNKKFFLMDIKKNGNIRERQNLGIFFNLFEDKNVRIKKINCSAKCGDKVFKNTL